MRFYLALAALLLILAGSSLGLSPVQAESCQVLAHYHEAVAENNATLLKMLGMINASDSPLDDPGVAGVYYSMLLSTRQYHEETGRTLPACAQPFNQLLIETISATQDVVGLKLAQAANPEQARYSFRLAQAVDHLNQKWQTMARRFEETQLQPEQSE